MSRLTVLLAVVAAAAATALPAAANSSYLITIRFQVQHHHVWAVQGGAYQASMHLVVAPGSVLRFVDEDMTSHRLVQLSGPRLPLSSATMATTGSSLQIVLRAPGTYTFETKPGKDFMQMQTVGRDNVLRLHVVVR